MKKQSIYTVLIFAGLFSLAACSSSEEVAEMVAVTEAPQKATKVKVVKIAPTQEALPIYSSGVVASKSETKLSFKIGGVIENIMVEEGQQVRKGQVLARLAQAEIRANVTQAESALSKARRDLERAQNLFKDSVATLEQLQNAQTGVEVAEASLQIASFNQQYSVIVAPSSGKVLKRFAEIRELAGPGVPIVLLASTDNAQVIRIGLADRDLVKLQLGNRATIQFDAYPQVTFEAKVSELAEAADPRTGTFEVELQLVPQGKPLKTGFVGKVQLYPANGEAYYRLPMGALVEAVGEQAYIYLPTPDGLRAQRKLVTPIHIGHDFFTVAAQELEGVTRVITDGNRYIVDQSPILIEGEATTQTLAIF